MLSQLSTRSVFDNSPKISTSGGGSFRTSWHGYYLVNVAILGIYC